MGSDTTPPSEIAPVEATGLSTELADLAQATRETIEASRAPSTLVAYAGDWKLFERWCARVGRQTLPAEPSTIAMYLVALAEGSAFPDEDPPRGPRKFSTCSRHLATISVRHQVAGHIPPPTWDPIVTETVRGLRRRLGVRPTRKTPVLPRDMKLMVHAHDARVDENTRIDMRIRDAAMLLVGFSGAFRRSELVSLDFDDVEFVDGGMSILLRRSKTDQEGAGRMVHISEAADPELCPVLAIHAWMNVLARRGVTNGALFVSLWRRGYLKRLSGKAVARLVQTMAREIGKDPEAFGGHSLRSGHVTAAARAGTRLDIIQKQTGHKSLDTLAGYIRDEMLSWAENSSAGLM